MLCEICSHIDFKQALREEGFKYHASCSDLVKSAERGCELCLEVWNCRSKKVDLENQYERPEEYYDSLCTAFSGKLTFRLSPYDSFSVWVGQESGIKKGTFEGLFESLLEIYTSPTSEAAKVISSRPIAKLSGSSTSYDLAKRWLKECCEQHLKYCSVYSESRLPTRIIDVGTSDGNYVYILVTQRQMGTWVSLSHCWGTKKHFTLSSSTPLDSPLDIQTLAPTFQDAITVTRRLGYRYLWIDSLCIIQDSHTDWATESSLMKEYYKHAIVTIAVDSAEGDHEGFLGKVRIPDRQGICIPFWFDQKQRGDVCIQECHKELKGSLGSRAWALQETLLSPRVLNFGKDMQRWYCSSFHHTEAVEGRKPSLFDSRLRLNPYLLPVKNGYADHGYTWMKIVGEYVRRKITMEGDRLPAISGIAREISAQTGMDYIVGLWEEDMHRGLLWTTTNEGIPYSKYIAPSWSWASIQLPENVEIGHNRLYNLIDGPYSALKTIATPMAYEVTPMNGDLYGDLYGQIKSASLEINGPMIAASRLYHDDQEPHYNLLPIDYSQAAPDPQTPTIQKIHLRSSTLKGDEYLWEGTLGQFFDEAPLYCSFDVRNDLADPSTRLLDNIHFLQIVSREYIFRRGKDYDKNVFVLGLILVSTEESGVYRRVGRACFPGIGVVARMEWERQTISII